MDEGTGHSLWDVEAGALRQRLRYPGADECLLALGPDGKTVAATMFGLTKTSARA